VAGTYPCHPGRRVRPSRLAGRADRLHSSYGPGVFVFGAGCCVQVSRVSIIVFEFPGQQWCAPEHAEPQRDRHRGRDQDADSAVTPQRGQPVPGPAGPY
jgi:hypothetical protein